MTLDGYLRSDGRKGIRNTIVVGYLVECAHHVAREVAIPFREHDVHVIAPRERADVLAHRKFFVLQQRVVRDAVAGLLDQSPHQGAGFVGHFRARITDGEQGAGDGRPRGGFGPMVSRGGRSHGA